MRTEEVGVSIDTKTQSTVTDELPSSSWSMELSRWRVRLRRLKRWSKYEGRASDGQFNTADNERHRSVSQPVIQRHSLSSVDVRQPLQRRQSSCYEPVVPPVSIPKAYRQQDRQRGVRVGGDRVPFTLDGHLRRRKVMRPLTRIVESEPYDSVALPDMRNSLASVYAYGCQKPSRSRRACSV